MKIIRVTRVRVIYKNGASQDFDVTDFTMRFGPDRKVIAEVKWTRHGDTRPVFLNVDEICAVWEIKNWRRLVWS